MQIATCHSEFYLHFATAGNVPTFQGLEYREFEWIMRGIFYANQKSTVNLSTQKNMETIKQPRNDNLTKQRQAVGDDLSVLAADTRALFSATADVAGEKAEAARKRLAAAVDNGKEMYGRVRDTALEKAKAADKVVRDRPYQALGLAFGLGALLGFLLWRRD